MNSSRSQTRAFTLWGVAHSYYTGKIRSYLTRKGIPFRELHPTHPRLQGVVMPAVGLRVVPILETPDGQIRQDTSDMIDHCESRQPLPLMIPETPVQRERSPGCWAPTARRDCWRPRCTTGGPTGPSRKPSCGPSSAALRMSARIGLARSMKRENYVLVLA